MFAKSKKRMIIFGSTSTLLIISRAVHFYQKRGEFDLSDMIVKPLLLCLIIFYCAINKKLPIFYKKFRSLMNHPRMKKILNYTGSLQTTEKESKEFFTMLLGLVFLVVSVCILEIKQPIFFTQDDNFAQFLPIIVKSYRSLLEGCFPTWNPYQFMGMPTTSIGVYALTYPLTLFSYLIAKNILGNEYLTIEVFVIIHLLLGYVVTYMMLRKVGIGCNIATVGSLCHVLSGYSLIAGRSWYYILPFIVWMPFLIMSILHLQKHDPSWKWIVWTGLTIGVFFHSGNAQIWIYSLMFYILTVIFLNITGQLSVQKMLLVVPAFLFGIAIACPLLIPQFMEMVGINRQGGMGPGIEKGIAAMLFPFRIVEVPSPGVAGITNFRYMSQFYFLSPFLAFAAFCTFLLVFYGVITYKRSKDLLYQLVKNNIWLLCALIAFIFALGEKGGVWWLFAKLPVFDKFNQPFKFLQMFNLFVVIGGSLFFDRFLKYEDKAKTLFLSGSILLLGFHIFCPFPSFYSYTEKPYPQIPKKMRETISNVNGQRIISFAPLRSVNRNYVISLKHNFPSIYSIYSIDGYDPLVASSPEYCALMKRFEANPASALRAYGVKWLVIHDTAYTPEYSSKNIKFNWERLSNKEKLTMKFLQKQSKEILKTSSVTLWEIKGSDSEAFVLENGIKQQVPIQFTANGVIADISKAAGEKLIINVLWKPAFVANVDGKVVTPEKDEWGRVVLKIPEGTKSAKIYYRPKWILGVYIGSGLLVFSFLFYFIVERSIWRINFSNLPR